MFEIAVQRAQNWYNVLAEQRMKLMNFYVILIVGNLALFGGAIAASNSLAISLIGLELSILSVVFKLLDRRTAKLIKISEAALEKLEARLAAETQIPEMMLIHHHESEGSYSLRVLFNVIFFTGFALGMLIIVTVILRALYPILA